MEIKVQKINVYGMHLSMFQSILIENTLASPREGLLNEPTLSPPPLL